MGRERCGAKARTRGGLPCQAAPLNGKLPDARRPEHGSPDSGRSRAEPARAVETWPVLEGSDRSAAAGELGDLGGSTGASAPPGTATRAHHRATGAALLTPDRLAARAVP